MSRAPTTTIEITFEGPCPGQLESIAALVCDGDVSLPARAGRTRAHLSQCPRCRAFSENLRHEKRLLRDHPLWRIPGSRDDVPAEFDRFRKWLENSITDRNGKALANSLHRLAQRLLWLDPQAAAIDWDPRSRVGSVPISELLRRAFGQVSHARASHDDTRRVLADVMKDSSLIDTRRRMALISRICELAHAVNGQTHARSTLVEAGIEWLYGAVRNVPMLLDRAISFAEDAHTKSTAIVNQSVASIDRGEVSEALRMAECALAVSRRPLVAVANAALWNILLGDAWRGREALRTLARAMRMHREYGSLPQIQFRRQIRFLSDLYDVRAEKSRAALTLLGEAAGFDSLRDRIRVEHSSELRDLPQAPDGDA